MDWKIIIKNLAIPLTILISYFATVILAGKAIDKRGDVCNIWWIIAHSIILIMAFIIFIFGISSDYKKKLEVQVSPEEQKELSPRIDIKLFNTHSHLDTDNIYPLQKYSLMIQNLNSNSVKISNLRIKFYFHNNIYSIKQNPLPYTRESVQINSMSSIFERKNGNIDKYEDIPAYTTLTNKFSLAIEQAKVNN
ncbi:hypothetical protein ACFL57_03855, partial [Candidatus Margulisiibacteriota bacterium]